MDSKIGFADGYLVWLYWEEHPVPGKGEILRVEEKDGFIVRIERID